MKKKEIRAAEAAQQLAASWARREVTSVTNAGNVRNNIKDIKKTINNILKAVGLDTYEYKILDGYGKGLFRSYKLQLGKFRAILQIDNSRNQIINITMFVPEPIYRKENYKTMLTIDIKPRLYTINVVYMPYARKYWHIELYRYLVCECTPQFISVLYYLVRTGDKEISNIKRKYLTNSERTESIDVIHIVRDKNNPNYMYLDKRGIEKLSSRIAYVLANTIRSDKRVTVLIRNADTHMNETYEYTYTIDDKEIKIILNVFATNYIKYIDYKLGGLYIRTTKKYLYETGTLRIINRFKHFYRLNFIVDSGTDDNKIEPYYIEETLEGNILHIKDIAKVELVSDLRKKKIVDITIKFGSIKKIAASLINKARGNNRGTATIEGMYAKYYYDRKAGKIYLVVVARDSGYAGYDIGTIIDKYNGFNIIVLLTGNLKYYDIINMPLSDREAALEILKMAIKNIDYGGKHIIFAKDVLSDIRELLNRLNIYKPITRKAIEEELHVALLDKVITEEEFNKYLEMYDKDPIRTLELLIQKNIITGGAL